jgi:heme/copper-type cytochrome/quinol oxidase subunit 2
MEKWNRSEWQGRSKAQVERNETIGGIITTVSLILIASLIIFSIIY